MKPGIRIVKHDAAINTNDNSSNQMNKTDRQLERETANTIKGWVAELKERKRSHGAALALFRSLAVLDDSGNHSGQDLLTAAR